MYCAINNHHISYSFSNHSLYTPASELHRSTSRLCIVLSITTTSLILSPIILSIHQLVSYIRSISRLCIVLSITTTSLILSPIILSVLQTVSYLEVQVYRLCIVLSITTTSLILSPIILSVLQPVSYLEVQVDCVLCYQ